MTDDERREDDTETTESSPESSHPSERPAHDVASRVDPVKRWGDPETRWGNPEVDLPNVPRVDIPGQSGDESLKEEFSDDAQEFTADVDPEQSRLFWASVILTNIGVAAVALGPMLIYFRGQTLIGLGVTLLGVAALARVYKTYREYQQRDWSDDENDGDDAESGDTRTDGNAGSDSNSTADSDSNSTAERNR
ncbi:MULTISPECIES: hypothetical protein [Haloferax]|uniref:DUF7322 domain-containing protein n=1 Tax=Haloferax TaxID=2251 RepID=UPI00177D78A0|nr:MULTISPECIES: hypothetical protein [Haloferax]